MERTQLLALLHSLKEGRATPEDVIRSVERSGFEELGFAKPDHQRARRLGFPEVVFAEGKQDSHLLEICRALLDAHDTLLVTRLTAERHAALATELPGGRYNPVARTWVFGGGTGEGSGDGSVAGGGQAGARQAGARQAGGSGNVLVLCAGTADLPVAEEATETARLMGSHTELIADVGVAGIHRLMSHRERIDEARVLVVVAGMEGALPSVVGGLARVPLIAVPTSIGYGTGLGGVAALMSMLNSCAPGVTVVNIDNGFGAGYAAHMINRTPAGE